MEDLGSRLVLWGIKYEDEEMHQHIFRTRVLLLIAIVLLIKRFILGVVRATRDQYENGDQLNVFCPHYEGEI